MILARGNSHSCVVNRTKHTTPICVARCRVDCNIAMVVAVGSSRRMEISANTTDIRHKHICQHLDIGIVGQILRTTLCQVSADNASDIWIKLRICFCFVPGNLSRLVIHAVLQNRSSYALFACAQISYNSTDARLNLCGSSSRDSLNLNRGVILAVCNGSTIRLTDHWRYGNLEVVSCCTLICCCKYQLTRSNAVVHHGNMLGSRAHHICQSTKNGNIILDRNVHIELHILDRSTINGREQRSLQAINLESLVATAIKCDCREAINSVPALNLRHIEVCRYAHRCYRAKQTNLRHLCQAHQVGLVLDNQLTTYRLGSRICHKLKLGKLLNNTCLYRVVVAVETNYHCVILHLVSEESDGVDTMLSRRNSHIDWSSLRTKSQALAKRHCNSVRRILVCGQSSVLAVYIEVARNLAALSNYGHRSQSFATLNSKAENACKMVELNSRSLLTLGKSRCVAIHRSSAALESTGSVVLRCREGYRIATLGNGSYTFGRSRIDQIVRSHKLSAECKLCGCAICLAGS